jgi:PEP-CTERM motif-containing protein
MIIVNGRAFIAAAVVTLASLISGTPPQQAWATIIYQNLPTSLASPPDISHHNATGPVIADDFVPTANTAVAGLTFIWWGNQPTSNQWELVLQNNNPALGEPALTPAGNNVTGGVKALPVTATGVATGIPGIFQFSANPVFDQPFNLVAGTDYWLTVANFNDGWNWALALNGPTIGTEHFNAHSSIGATPDPCADGGPHCGPWTDIHTDFALQIGVPEPSALALLAGSIGLFGVFYRRRKGRERLSWS